MDYSVLLWKQHKLCKHNQYHCVLIILIGYIYMYTIMKQGRSLGQGNCIWCECSVRSLSSLGLCGRWGGCVVSFHEQGSDGG